jgi:(2Fe-2S) ferredoxin
MTTITLKGALEAGRTALQNTSKTREILTRFVPRLDSFMSKHASEGLAAEATELQVCTTGPNCCKRGSIELAAELRQRVADQSLPITVVETGCLHRCSQGPNVQVGSVCYTRMNSEKLTELLESHVRAKQLSITLLADSEYVGDAVSCEEKRCRLVVDLGLLETVLVDLTGALEAALVQVPLMTNKVLRTLAEVELMQAIDLEKEVKAEIISSRQALASVIALDQFVTIALARKTAERNSSK